MNTKYASKILSVIAVAAAAGVATPRVSASPIPYELVLTEVSSTVLTYTYSNSLNPMPFTVAPVGTGDIWNITADSSIILDTTFEYTFVEDPSEPGKVNVVVKGSASSPIFTVNSDFADVGDPIATQGHIGTDNGVPIIVKFIDLAAAAETASNGVPEGGSSLGLLALSSAALAGLTRLRRLRPA